MIKYRYIGIIRTPFKEPSGTPIQPSGGHGVKATVEILPEYAEGLTDIEGFSHIILIYHFHLIKEPKLMVRPFMDESTHGVFATRAPSRPNPIGISVVRLVQRVNNLLQIQDVDIVDGTPLLDLKPYVPEFEQNEAVTIGWLEGKTNALRSSRDDGRFSRS